MNLVTTTFIVIHPIFIPVTSGGGWNLREELEQKAKPGDYIICTTKQTHESIIRDMTVTIQFPNDTYVVGFEILGRYIASGTIKQVENN